MATWSEFEAAAPDLARDVRTRLESHKHLTLATLRADGAPRISGIEAQLVEGDLWIGSMLHARKAQDLRRDPRYALHSGSEDPPEWTGDAKVSGTAEEVTDPARVQAINGESASPEGSHLFRLELREAVSVHLDDARKALIIEVWAPERGLRTIRR